MSEKLRRERAEGGSGGEKESERADRRTVLYLYGVVVVVPDILEFMTGQRRQTGAVLLPAYLSIGY